MPSSIRFLDASGRPLDALPDADLAISSAGLDWPGIAVESGRNDSWTVDDLSPDRHYLALNISARPLSWEAKIGGRFRRVESAPGGLWFCPPGDRFSHRVRQSSEFVLVTIAAKEFSRWTGERPFAMHLRYGLESTQAGHLMRSLAAEAGDGGGNGRLFVDAVGAALAVSVGNLFGLAPSPAPGALSAVRLRRVLDYIEAHLDREQSVDELARVTNYSAAHFARAFKRAMRQSPHRYVLGRRLERARAAIGAGLSPAEVSGDFGFSDQSHFTKAFRSAYGVTPARHRA